MYVHEFDDQDAMEQFLERHNLQSFHKKEIDNPNRPIFTFKNLNQ